MLLWRVEVLPPMSGVDGGQVHSIQVINGEASGEQSSDLEKERRCLQKTAEMKEHPRVGEPGVGGH